MTIDDCYQLGYIVKTHGLKGEVQIYLDVDAPSDYRNLESVRKAYSRIQLLFA